MPVNKLQESLSFLIASNKIEGQGVLKLQDLAVILVMIGLIHMQMYVINNQFSQEVRGY